MHSSSTGALSKLKKRKKPSKKRQPKKLSPLNTERSTFSLTSLSSTSSLPIVSKRDLQEAVRRCAPRYDTLSYEGTVLKRGVNLNAMKTRGTDAEDVDKQVNLVESGVNLTSRRYNDLKVANDQKTRELKAALDELKEMKLEFDALESMKKQTNEEGKRIEFLMEASEEAKLEAEAHHHKRRKLEAMLQRLKDNELKYGAYLSGMEDTIKGMEKEYTQTRLLKKRLEGGRARAADQLRETEQDLGKIRHERGVNIQVRRGEASDADHVEEWLQKREEMQQQLINAISGDLTADEESVLREELKVKEAQQKALLDKNEGKIQEELELEAQFEQIKQVMGISSIGEILDKFTSQSSARALLQKERDEAEQKLKAAKKSRDELKEELASLKGADANQVEISREEVEALNRSIAELRVDRRLQKASLDRLASVQLRVRQGVSGLFRRVDDYLHLLSDRLIRKMTADAAFLTQDSTEEQKGRRDDVFSRENGNPSSSSAQTKREEYARDVRVTQTMLKEMSLSEAILLRMMEMMGGSDSPGKNAMDGSPLNSPNFFKKDQELLANTSAHHTGSFTFLTEDEGEGGDGEHPADLLLGAQNVRVWSSQQQRERESSEGLEEPKKNRGVSGQGSHEPRRGKERKEGDNSNNNKEEGDDGDGGEDGEEDDDEKETGPSLQQSSKNRQAVKESSMAVSKRALRKEQERLREQREAERMLSSSEDMADEKQREQRFFREMRRKQQDKAMQGLAKHHTALKLPGGLTLRDEPMKRTNVFLQSKPDLS